MRDRRITYLWLPFLLGDFCAVIAAYYVTIWLRFDWSHGDYVFDLINRLAGVDRPGALTPAYKLFYQASAFRIISILTVICGVLYALRDLYTERRFIMRRSQGANIVIANLTALALIYAYFYLSRNTFHPRSMFALVIVLNMFFCVFFRGMVDRALGFLRRRWWIDRWRVLLVGRGRHADFIESVLNLREPHGLLVAERLDIAPHEDIGRAVTLCEQKAAESRADMFIVADKDMTVSEIMVFLEMADRLDLPVKLLSDKLDVLVSRSRIRFDIILGTPLYHFSSPSVAEQFQWCKAVVSRCVAGLALALLSPFLLLISLAIWLTSRGPVLFVQERIGFNRKPFKIYKFRTMYDDAEVKLSELEQLNESAGALFKITEDPRVTPVGRFIRRYSLDELPQLINVVLGDMTLVGPRPLPKRDFENYYEDWHYGRHKGLPGLTCLWQVSGRSDLDFHNMCILDVFYLRNQNWVLDLKIILRTASVVVFAEGAY